MLASPPTSHSLTLHIWRVTSTCERVQASVCALNALAQLRKVQKNPAYVYASGKGLIQVRTASAAIASSPGRSWPGNEASALSEDAWARLLACLGAHV